MAARKPPVGVIGLGLIGSRVAANLRRAGHDVWGWNRSPKPEPNFLASAAEVADTADLILLFVSDGPALLRVLADLEPVLAARHLIVNCATVSPDEAREAADIAARASAGFFDAPFTGSRDAASAGHLVHFLSGPDECMERIEPVLSVSARALLRVGPRIGQASALKLATNLLAAAQVQALSEALALLDSQGIGGNTFAGIFAEHGTRSKLADMKLPGMITGDFETHFALKHMRKDMRLALEVAAQAGLELPAARATAEALEGGMARGWGELDYTAVARHFSFPGREPAPVRPPAV